MDLTTPPPPPPKQTIGDHLPVDPGDAVSMLVNRMATGSWSGTATGFAALTEMNVALAAGDDPQAIRAALARQSVLLEQVFLQMTGRAINAPRDGDAFLRMALSAQQAGLRTLVALAAMGERRAAGD